jgi:UDP-glucose 4-epimerase
VSNRALVTGADTFWGARVAQALERDPAYDVVIAMGAQPPPVELEKAEFVSADQSYAIMSRIVKATKVDTIIHTFMKTDSRGVSAKDLNETNVIATMNLLAAASASTSVRKVVVKSSTSVYGSTSRDPAFFKEESRPSEPLTSPTAISIANAESYLRDFADDNPHILVTLLRFSNVVGSDIKTTITENLRKGICPYVIGFDPNIQFTEEDDVVRALEFAAKTELPGIYNVAGDNPVCWSQVAHITGTHRLGILAIGTNQIASIFKTLRLLEVNDELFSLLRYGRGVLNQRLKEAGFEYRYDTRSALENFTKNNRIKKTLGEESQYKYEKDVELFLRHSPAVVKD